MSIFGKFSKKDMQPAPQQKPQQAPPPQPQQKTTDARTLMLAQFPALYMKSKHPSIRVHYISTLGTIGFSEKDAEALFDFDCAAIEKYNKQYLLHMDFTKLWFFGLKQPFFLNYPKNMDDILKEKFFTVSELAKLVDEAEWHFWNSHEKELPDEVWQEIYTWRRNGKGGEFCIKYCEMISQTTGIPLSSLAALVSHEGQHLSTYKWH